MGEVISLEQRRRARTGVRELHGAGRRPPAGTPPRATFWFDLASPGTYLAAERADRLFPGLVWRPVIAAPGPPADAAAFRAHDAEVRAATARALELRMPLVWPEGAPGGGRAARRVAAYAAERGQASAFVLAASRLAFCGGFDLDDPEILAEAAAAAALPLQECLRAAGDRGRDVALEAAGREIAAAGADQLPAISVGSRLFSGEERLGQAAAAVRDPCLVHRGSLDDAG